MGNTISARTKRTQRDYNLAFKLSLVNRVEKGEFTHKQAKKTGLQGPVFLFRKVKSYTFLILCLLSEA